MAKYDPRNTIIWEGMQFTRADGNVYTIRGQQITDQDIGEKAILIFLGGTPASMNRNERVQRVQVTQKRLENYSKELVASILEKREVAINLHEICADPREMGIYDVLQFPKVGDHLGFAVLSKEMGIVTSCRSPVITKIETL